MRLRLTRLPLPLPLRACSHSPASVPWQSYPAPSSLLPVMADPYSDDELSLMDSADGTGSSPRGSVRASPSELASLAAGVEGRPSPSSSSSSAHLAGRGGRGVGMSAGPAGMGAPRMAPGSFRAFILSAALAETAASFLLVFMTLTALYAANMVGDDALQTGSLLMVALSYGLTYGCLVYALSLNGGGYVPSVRQMNPALTLALYLLGKIDAVKAAIIVTAQVCGGVLGTTILWACFSTHNLRTYELFDGTNVWQKLVMSILVSFLSCFLLVITNFAVVQPTLQQSVSTDTSEQAPQTVHELNSLISSLVSVIGVAVGTPLTGCFMNPMLAMCVLAVSHWRHSILVVILGPVIGAALAALAAKLFSYRVRAPFLTSVRWGAGGMGGLGLGNLHAGRVAHQMHTFGAAAPAGPRDSVSVSMGGGRANPFDPRGHDEKQGSRF